MKFEDFLMQRSEDLQRRLDLQAEVQVLLAEIAIVEEEIICLERKIEKLKLHLYQEKQKTREWKLQQQQQGHLVCKLGSRKEYGDLESPRPTANVEFRKCRPIRDKRASLGSASELTSHLPQGDDYERPRLSHEENQNQSHLINEQVYIDKPNKITEELIKCLIGIFVKLNCTQNHQDSESSAIVPKLTLSCMNSKGFMPRTSFNRKTPQSSDDNQPLFDPYGILPDVHSPVRDIGPYKYFIHLTSSSLDMTRISQCLLAVRELRVLMDKLCAVDLSLLTHKQKLAFWINIYNACIMHAFLQHGLPSTPDKLLALMNKAMLNVGGIVLNALAIEHFILRHPCDSRNGAMDEKESLLRRAYGLGYPEPNVMFALCHGSWSSPALRVYTADNVVIELEKAKVEFLEASIGVSCKKKIVVPKLLYWHMRDFADDVESLMEWIYSQLPRSGQLKQLIMECLNGDSKTPMPKMVEIQPYESEFRYLLPL